jgi:hypothetical protein
VNAAAVLDSAKPSPGHLKPVIQIGGLSGKPEAVHRKGKTDL